MLELIGSNEFGDWLLAEISEASALSESADVSLSRPARLRLDTLEVAKKLLHEFLLLQQSMLAAASEARIALGSDCHAALSRYCAKDHR